MNRVAILQPGRIAQMVEKTLGGVDPRRPDLKLRRFDVARPLHARAQRPQP